MNLVISILTVSWTELCSPPNSYVEALTLSVNVFEDRTYKMVVKVKWGHRVGP